ncbi:MAG: leucyl/phenylalanyl-tRNA--protein transferase [Rhodospirillales bacterium]|nr:leucyl/phenylalanyl-tRNA--protein transferase [Rhodospirillales bacterium]
MDHKSAKQSKLTAELVLRAYAAGIFPMAESHDDPTVFWVDPRVRGVLPLETFHVPRSLRKIIRRGDFDVRCDTAFADVVELCAETNGERQETWINEEIRRAYIELHQRGFAHSVECWRDGVLVGGLYGVSLGCAFFGESMFSREANASKVALAHLVARLRMANYRLLDTQFVTEHLRQFGAVEIPCRIYLERLEEAIRYQTVFPADPDPEELDKWLFPEPVTD